MAQQLPEYTRESIESLRFDDEEFDDILAILEEDEHFFSSPDCPQIWTIIDNFVVDLRTFVMKHPGGHYPILQHVGTDATAAFVQIHSGRAKQQLKTFIIGRVVD